LTAFALHENRVLSREWLSEEAWGVSPEPGDRTVDYTIVRIRRTFRREMPGWEFIHTHRSLGYRFHAERSQGFHKTGTSR
jgi:two-component system, OmpR family, response regulator